MLWLWHGLYSFGPHPVSNLHIYAFVVSRAFIAVEDSQAGDADFFRAPGLTSGLHRSVNVHRDALLLVPQSQCISNFVFYILFCFFPVILYDGWFEYEREMTKARELPNTNILTIQYERLHLVRMFPGRCGFHTQWNRKDHGSHCWTIQNRFEQSLVFFRDDRCILHIFIPVLKSNSKQNKDVKIKTKRSCWRYCH